ncbi:MAG: sugar ABC transporter permease, partial [Treponema sp.]|nr:sugar ABC transporter permease [Treponema sp.]
MIPAFLIVFAVLIFPIVFSFVVSLFDWPLSAGGGARRFVGPGNYVELVRDKEFWNSLRLQLGFIFIAIPIEIALGLGAALLLNREFRGGRVVRALI